MFKKIVWIILKYIFYTFLIAVLGAFLAKTHNMPAAVPEKYVEKIIEITDRILISLNLIKDERIIEKYRKLLVKKEEAINFKRERNFIEKFFNYLTSNGYDIKYEERLDLLVLKLKSEINLKKAKLESIAKNPYIKSALISSETLSLDSYTEKFLNSIIKESKMILAFILKENKSILKVVKNENFNFDSNQVLKMNFENYNFQQADLNNETLIFYTYPLSDNYSLIFIISPQYFFKEVAGNYNEDFFIFDKNKRIIFSKYEDSNLLEILSSSISRGILFYNKKSYRIISRNAVLDYNIGIFYLIYPIWKIVLNLLRIIFALGLIWLFIYIFKHLIDKLKEYKSKGKEDEISILTAAMEEIAKSIKYSVEASNLKSYSKLDIESIVKEIKNLTGNLKSSEIGISDNKKEEKVEEEWKLIE